MSYIRDHLPQADLSQSITPEALCHLVEREVPNAIASVMVFEFESKTAILRWLVGDSLPLLYRRRVRSIHVGAQNGCCGAAAYWRNTVVTSDIQRDPRWALYRSAAHRAGLRSCWSTPIIAPDHGLLGTLAVYSNRVGSPDPCGLEMTSAVASLLVPALAQRCAR